MKKGEKYINVKFNLTAVVECVGFALNGDPIVETPAGAVFRISPEALPMWRRTDNSALRMASGESTIPSAARTPKPILMTGE